MSLGCALALALVLAACGSAPTTAPAPVAPSPPSPGPAAPDPWARGLNEFEARQRAQADAATAQGRWADASAALEVLRAMRPEDAALAQQLAQARSAAEGAARDKLQRAKQASARGDSEAAARAYLEALVLSPGLNEAADGLRTIERERVRRQHLGKLSRYAMGNPAAALQADAPAQTVQNELEHASLLADQGEFDAAVATLSPLADKRGADRAVLSLLAEIHFRHAESLGRANRPAAIAALERCLKLDRNHARASALLKEMKAR